MQSPRTARIRRPLAALVAVGSLALATGCGTTTTAPTSSAAAIDRAGAAAPAGSGSADAPTDKAPTRTRAGDVAPALDFTADRVGGGTFEGSSLAGKPVVLWFWAPWCPTCVAQIDGVGALAEEYGDDVEVVGVGGLDEASALDGFAAEVSPDVTVLSDPDGAVWRHFGVTAQSTYVVLGADAQPVGGGALSDSELAAVVADTVG